jgi:uncharacterized protein YkwD
VNWWRQFLEWFKPKPKPPSNPGGVKFASQVMPIESFDAKKLLSLHNAERFKHALAPLLPGPKLSVDAQARASHAASVNLTGPHLHDGFAPHPGDIKAGENAAMGQADSASVMADWMSSSGHRANILDPQFSRMGCGRATSVDKICYWYSIFAG